MFVEVIERLIMVTQIFDAASPMKIAGEGKQRTGGRGVSLVAKICEEWNNNGRRRAVK